MKSLHRNKVCSRDVLAAYTTKFKIPVYELKDYPSLSGLVLCQVDASTVHVCAYVERSFKYYRSDVCPIVQPGLPLLQSNPRKVATDILTK